MPEKDPAASSPLARKAVAPLLKPAQPASAASEEALLFMGLYLIAGQLRRRVGAAVWLPIAVPLLGSRAALAARGSAPG